MDYAFAAFGLEVLAMTGDPLVGILVLAAAVAAFLFLREVFCWYWKINEAVLLLRQIRDALTGAPPVEIGKVPRSTLGPLELVDMPPTKARASGA